MLARIGNAQPQARLDGFLVQRMVPTAGCIELLAGIADDPVFGPVILFGQGGTAVEIIDDSAVGLPPLNPLLARAQMARTRVWRLLQGYRDKPPAAIDAVADVLIRLGRLAAEHPEIRELDINPLLADASRRDRGRRPDPRRAGGARGLSPGDRALPEGAGRPRRGCATAPRSTCARSGPRTSRCCTISSRI